MIARKFIKLLNYKSCRVRKRLNPLVKYISSSPNNFNLPQIENNLEHFSLEGNYARNVLRSSEVYLNSLAKSLSLQKDVQIDNAECLLNKDWTTMSNIELLDNFEHLSYYAFEQKKKLTDDEFIQVLWTIKQQCTQFTDDQLFHLFKCLELWSLNREFYKIFGKVLDDECIQRCLNWPIDKILLMNDYFLKSKINKYSKFVKYSLSKLNSNEMTPANIVQYAYLLKVNQRLSFLCFNKFEHNVQKYFNKFTMEEIGIICMAFFKYESAIKNKNLLLNIIEKLQANLDSVSDITLTAHLKMLRFSVNLNIIEQVNRLLDSLISQVPHRSIQTLTHIAHMQGKNLTCNHDLILKILERFEKDIEIARLKDIERILFILYIFNYDPKKTPFYSIAIEELLKPSRTEEIKVFPSSFVYCILFVLQVNFYHEEALKRIMDLSFINMMSKNNVFNLNREYLVLDHCIEIEHPEYKGPRIQKNLLNLLIKKFGALSNINPTKYANNMANKLTTDVAHTIKQCLNSELAVHIDSLLPHITRSDIILCYNPYTKKFVSPVHTLSKIPAGTIKYAPKDGKKWYAVVIGTHNYLIRSSFKPSGALAVHLRHLECIGYTPILVRYNEWHNVRHENAKKEYVKQLLHNYNY